MKPPSPPLVLLVEDDRAIRESTARALARDGFLSHCASNGVDGLAAFESARPDLALIDIMLPDIDGLTICREIRKQSQIPIVFLTARSDPIDVVLGLEAGADDYVVKPFDPPVLSARLRAALRRATIDSRSASEQRTLKAAGFEIDLDGHVVRRDNEPLQLTPTEFRLLAELALHIGVVLDRSTLLQRVWGYGWSGDTRLVDVHIQRLRTKLEVGASQPSPIVTVRGVGYKLLQERDVDSPQRS